MTGRNGLRCVSQRHSGIPSQPRPGPPACRWRPTRRRRRRRGRRQLRRNVLCSNGSSPTVRRGTRLPGKYRGPRPRRDLPGCWLEGSRPTTSRPRPGTAVGGALQALRRPRSPSRVPPILPRYRRDGRGVLQGRSPRSRRCTSWHPAGLTIGRNRAGLERCSAIRLRRTPPCGLATSPRFPASRARRTSMARRPDRTSQSTSSDAPC